jgi:uncharacterized membrane protein
MNAFAKTSLLVIATIFTGTGATLLAGTDKLWGAIFLIIAVGIISLRGWLEKKGVITNDKVEEPK